MCCTMASYKKHNSKTLLQIEITNLTAFTAIIYFASIVDKELVNCNVSFQLMAHPKIENKTYNTREIN